MDEEIRGLSEAYLDGFLDLDTFKVRLTDRIIFLDEALATELATAINIYSDTDFLTRVAGHI